MSSLDKALVALRSLATSRESSGTMSVDARIQLVVTLGFIVAVLSVPLSDPGRLVWMFCFPIIMSEAFGLGYARVLRQSLWLLPLIALVGVFNPILDRTPQWILPGGLVVSRGWVSFAAVSLRGLLSAQALLVLIGSCGFNDMCLALGRLGVPNVMVTQLLMLYRFLTVVLQEALTMDRARKARGFGRRSYPLTMWATFTGQLLLRAIGRARRINRAMLARGFTGTLPIPPLTRSLRVADWAYLGVWGVAIALLRFLPLSAIAERVINNI